MESNEELIPSHLIDLLRVESNRLMLAEWKIKARRMDQRDMEDGRAEAYVTPTIRTAIIALSEEIREMSPDDPDVRRVIVHELLHVFFADISEYLMQNVFSKLYHPVAIELARDGFTFLFEQKVDLLARILTEKTDAS